jgi:hypothetical protein
VDDWADDTYDHNGLEFIGGSSLHVHTEMHPVASAGMNTFGRAPVCGVPSGRRLSAKAQRIT